ncbi:MAG: hypothetical protein AAFS10_04530, partial [Myxococcota bacterium]
ANGNMDASLGNFTDHAVGIGPVYLGLLHVITPRLFFEARAGVGAVWFANDRLISSDLSAQGDSHLGIQFGAELRARTATPSGLTGSLGLNLSRVNLPNSNGGFLGISPTLGYLSWDAGYRGFWLVEVGYSYPLINGMNPEFGDSSFDPPIDATWQQLTLSIGFGY